MRATSRRRPSRRSTTSAPRSRPPAPASPTPRASRSTCATQSDFAAMNEVYRGYWTEGSAGAHDRHGAAARTEGLVEIAVVAVPDGGERVVVNPSDWIVVAEPVQLRRSRPATRCSSSGPDQPQRQGQHADQGRHGGADQDGARQRRRGAQGRRHELTPTSSRRASTSPTRRRSRT